MANIDINSKHLHLANWFIKSSPHMPKLPQHKHNGVSKGHLPSPHWLPAPPPPQGVFKPAPSPFTSQTNLNLPLQIFTAPPYDGQKPKLRRFNSHDTSANMFSVTEFENNARMAKQVKQWQSKECDSMNRKNSLNNEYYSTSRESSGGQSRGGGGGVAAAGAGDDDAVEQSPPQEIMPIDKFLQKSVLPKVVRVFSPNNYNETGKHGSDAERGRLMFIYRHIPNRKIFKAHGTRSSDKRRCLKIPQELKGINIVLWRVGQK